MGERETERGDGKVQVEETHSRGNYAFVASGECFSESCFPLA